MSGQTENRTISIIINDQQLEQVVLRNQKLYEKLNEQIKKLEPGTEAYIKKATEMDKVAAKIQQTEDILSGKLSPTLSMLQKQQRELNNVLSNMPIELQKASKEAAQLDAVKAKIAQIKQEAVGTNLAVKQLGNEQISFAQKAKSGFGAAADGFNKYFGMITAGIAALAGITFGFKKANQAANEFESSIANLSALTGLMGDDLKWLEKQAKDMSTSVQEGSVRITKSAKDIVDAYTIVGSQRPELLKNKEALNEVTKSSLILAEASKIELVEATKAVTTTLNQFNVAGDQSNRIMNVLAAGSKEGAGEVSYLSTALEKSGTQANMAKLSIEETVGAIETLAPRITQAEIAGTAFRGTLLKLEMGADEFKPSVVGLDQALENLAARKMNATQMEKMFGEQNITAASILIKYRKEVEAYTKAVTGSNVAIEQATINTSTRSATAAQRMNQIQNDVITLGTAMSGVFNGSLGVISTFTKALADLVKVPVSEAMEKDRIELRKLEVQLYQTNIPQAERVKIIKELQEKYPSYLGNIDAETATNEELRSSLKKVNDELINKIILQKQDEKIEKQNQSVASAQIGAMEQEDVVREKMVKAAEKYNLTIKETGTLQEQAIDIYKRAHEIDVKNRNVFQGKAFNDVAQFGSEIRRLGENYDHLNAMQNRNNALLSEREALIKRLGIKIETPKEIITQKTPEEKPSVSGGLSNAQKTKLDSFKELQREIELISNEAAAAVESKNEKEVEKVSSKYAKLRDKAAEFYKELPQIAEEYLTLMRQLNDAEYNDKLVVINKQIESAQKAYNKVTEDFFKSEEAKTKKMHAETDKQIMDAYRVLMHNEKIAEEASNTEKGKTEHRKAIALLETQKLLENDELSAQQRQEIWDAYYQKVGDLEDQLFQKQISNAQEYANQAIAVFENLASIKDNNSQTDIEREEIRTTRVLKVAETEKDSQLKILDDKYKADTANSEGNERAKTSFKEKYDADKLAIETRYNALAQKTNDELENKKKVAQKESAERAKKLAVFQTLINTSAAIVKMLADPGGIAGVALSILAGITGGAELAEIKSRAVPQFFDGGYTGDGNPHDVAGIVHKEEYVVNNELMADPAVFRTVQDFETQRTTGKRVIAERDESSATNTAAATQTQVIMPDNEKLISVLNRVADTLEGGINANVVTTEENIYKLEKAKEEHSRVYNQYGKA